MPPNRRRFLQASLALYAGTYLSGGLANNLTAKILHQAEEVEKRKRAWQTLRLASPYRSADFDFIPHMHLQLKQHIESLTQGKVYVEIHDNGALGVGRALMAAVTRGRIDAALISVSNLSRALPLLDILNIPFWLNSDQAYLNLITSPTWQKMVLQPIQTHSKLTVLLQHVVGSRTMTTTKHYKRLINTPDALTDVTMRVPASRVLNHFYSMTAANVVDVPWDKAAQLARNGQIDALDPSVVGLYAGPDNLKSEIGQVAKIASVPDAWVTVLNQQWLAELPTKLKQQVEQASQLTFSAHLAEIKALQQRCEMGLKQAGAEIYQPSRDELALWQSRYGHHKQAWNSIKSELLGSTQAFNQLLDATQTPSKYSLS
ncbi:TRAP transporter substrate-binding protein [Pseudoalteromonas 'SMAR']|uniref:TRAP transporter substrate-binding protein n=1 Tax=Pseudoalteromonas 'SMAR' TaxID=3416908 RepID=UPI003AF25A29